MSREAFAKFNVTAAKEFFEFTEGLSYGYHNFLFGWIDTPKDNYPPLLPDKLMPIIFSFVEKIMPEQMDILLDQGLNKRLGTEGLKLPDLARVAAERDMTLE